MYQVITDPVEKAEFLIKLFSHKSVANDQPAVMCNAGLREHEIGDNMKYETGIKDKYGNTAYDWVKVCNDMKRVIQGKIKFSKALYHVMMQRFTIAHYDRYGWFSTYNGNWDCLAKQIHKHDACTGDLTISQEEENALFGLVHFLMVNADKKLDEEKAL